MKLNTLAFKQISNKSKTYEIRLYDEKRRKIKVGDKIVFSELPSLENKIEVNVRNLIIANNFEELFTKFDPILAGWEKDDSPSKCADDMSEYYSKEDQEKYGVVAIEVELNKKSVKTKT
jgi:ASC-1-like (ASCH) protein